MSKSKLQQINEQKKRLNAEARAIKEERQQKKQEYKILVKDIATLRRKITNNKKQVKHDIAELSEAMTSRSLDRISNLADSIVENSSQLASDLRKFGERIDLLEKLDY